MLKVHFAPNSRAGRIIWLLEELGLSYEVNKMEFHPKDLKSDAHRARHPLGRVPVLDDGEIRIYESGAIIEFILERHKNGGLKPSIDSSNYPEYLQWFHYCEGMIMPPINTSATEIPMKHHLKNTSRFFGSPVPSSRTNLCVAVMVES